MAKEQKRFLQLSSLISGTLAGMYHVYVTGSDGRLMQYLSFEEEYQCNDAYEQAMKNYGQIAHVRKTIEFDF